MSALTLSSAAGSAASPDDTRANPRHDAARPIGKVLIARHLNGPRGFANGGFASGSVAQHVDSETPSVVLERPVPLGRALRVFDDGTKTYIQFPVNMAATEAPPLFLVGSGGKAELVNYRYLNGYYIVDRLIDVAELRIGEKPQSVVRITRTAQRG